MEAIASFISSAFIGQQWAFCHQKVGFWWHLRPDTRECGLKSGGMMERRGCRRRRAEGRWRGLEREWIQRGFWRLMRAYGGGLKGRVSPWREDSVQAKDRAEHQGRQEAKRRKKKGPEVTVRERKANKIGRGGVLVETQSTFKSYLKIT